MKKNVGEGLSKCSEIKVKMQKEVTHQNRKLIPGVTTFSMTDCLASLAHKTDNCIDLDSWNVVLFPN